MATASRVEIQGPGKHEAMLFLCGAGPVWSALLEVTTDSRYLETAGLLCSIGLVAAACCGGSSGMIFGRAPWTRMTFLLSAAFLRGVKISVQSSVPNHPTFPLPDGLGHGL